jgi:hypothetical protein
MAPRTAIAAFGAEVGRRRQTFRAYRWERLPIFLPALAVALGVAFVVNLAYVEFATYGLGMPKTLFNSMDSFAEYFRDHTLSMVIACVANVLATLISVFVVIYCLRLAWRNVRRSADDVLAEAAYKPIVFLRSFRDEDACVQPRSFLSWLFRRQPRLEEVVANLLSPLGPAVAIGVPGERAPRLGAMRAYFADDDWQKAVRTWSDRSELIVVLAGTSHWALWELRYVMDGPLQRRTMLVLPPDRTSAERTIRWQVLCQAMQNTRWSAAMTALHPERTLCVAFEPHGAIFVVNGRVHQVDYELAIEIAATEIFAWNATMPEGR